MCVCICVSDLEEEGYLQTSQESTKDTSADFAENFSLQHT